MKRLLLIGAGHAHAQVLRDWVQAPVPDVELVLVSPAHLAPVHSMPGREASQALPSASAPARL